MDIELESKLISEFSRDPNEKVCVSLRDYKGRVYFDIRIWFQNTETPGFFPSKRGICMGVEFLPQLKMALTQLEACDLQTKTVPPPVPTEAVPVKKGGYPPRVNSMPRGGYAGRPAGK